jgi:hypothetical protein
VPTSYFILVEVDHWTAELGGVRSEKKSCRHNTDGRAAARLTLSESDPCPVEGARAL